MNFIGIADYMFAKEGCYICGRNEGLVDTGAYIEGEGALAICDLHIKEMARTVPGMGPMIEQGQRVEQLEAELAQADADTAEARAEVVVLADRLAGLQVEWVDAVETASNVKHDQPAKRGK